MRIHDRHIAPVSYLDLFPSPLISARAKVVKVVARSALCEKHNGPCPYACPGLTRGADGAITGEQEYMRRLLVWWLSRVVVLVLAHD